MTEIKVDINKEIYKKLAHQASKHGISTEEELKRILTSSVTPLPQKKTNRKEFLAWVKDFSKQAGPQKTDSVEIIRELRENL